MIPADIRPSRRAVLTSTVWSLAAAGGCDFGTSPEPDTEPDRSEVPLRVSWIGSSVDPESVRRAWSSVSTLPLEIDVVDLDRAEPADTSQRWVDASEGTDVVIHPLAGLAELFATNKIVSLGGEELARIDEANGPLLTALHNGAARYAGQEVCVPLGGRLPAVVSGERAQPLESWSAYADWVRALDGAAAEPSAGGWAAAMFLWRAGTTVRQGWLFEREAMEPTIASDAYVDVLDQMRETVSRYAPGRLTAAEVWQRLHSGQLRGGIGFPVGDAGAETPLQFARLPGVRSGRRVLFDPFTPVGSLAADCRQTAAAKQFLRWLAGGTGSEVVRSQVSGMTVTRASAGTGAAGGEPAGDGYEVWLKNSLEQAVTRPTLQLLRAGDYYAALDRQVERCLEGKKKPAAALAEVAHRWRKLTAAVGRESQQRAWRRAQGMLG